MKPRTYLSPDLDIVEYLGSLEPGWRSHALAMLPEHVGDALDRAWSEWAHDGQLEPPGNWSTWVIKAGRGFGKTLAGAQWIASLVADNPDTPLRFALVGATLDDARRVMIEGKSGLLEVAGAWVSEWHASLGRLRFRTGAEATLFSGATPHLLRGPEHHYAWCDELAKWEKAEECWDMLQLGLRLGRHPRALITTTPRSGSVLQPIMDQPDTVVTGGPTRANPHLAPSWKQRVERLYAGTRLGRQELDGVQLPDVAGALWTVELLERCRVPPRNGEGDHAQHGGGDSRRRATSAESASPHVAPLQTETPLRQPTAATSPSRGGYSRTLIAVDPPSGDGTCGIIACAREGSGDSAIAHVLADHSVTALRPEGWAAAVAAAARAHGTRQVVAEANQGGKMIQAVLHTADQALRVKLVHARAGKSHRAEPVSHLFEAGRAFLHGKMPELEAQLLGLIAGGGYEGPGHSPDRADAMVWGLTELMLGRRAEPKVWRV